MFIPGSDILLPAWMILLCALPVGLARRLDASDVGLVGVRARGVVLVAWCLLRLGAGAGRAG
jgi:hypothetical protein